ncbi:MAG: nucleoside triphosphate pyrophosphatase [Candidatus Methanomethylicia archaeon]
MIILVSRSERRIELLKRFKFKFKVLYPKYEEEILEDPIKTVKTNAINKVKSVLNQYLKGAYVGVDTVIYVDGETIEKPKSLEDARRILMKISGKWHKVISGLYIYDNTKGIEVFKYVETEVKFKDLNEEELEWYLSTNEPMNAAGGYMIQGLGGLFIEEIKGDYYNVVGLPINLLYKTLLELGYNPLTK